MRNSQTTVIRILADHIWLKNMEKGLQFSQSLLGKKYGNSAFTMFFTESHLRKCILNRFLRPNFVKSVLGVLLITIIIETNAYIILGDLSEQTSLMVVLKQPSKKQHSGMMGDKMKLLCCVFQVRFFIQILSPLLT